MTTPALLPLGEWACASANELARLGARLGNFLQGGDIVLLYGELGAGKTTFAKGIAECAGIAPEDVTSPSFTLVNRYEGRDFILYHLDLYRLSPAPANAHTLGLDDILADLQAVTLIEWPERLGDYELPAPLYRVTINGDGEQPRNINIVRVD